MPQTCPRCSRKNPDAAAYCHFDGEALAEAWFVRKPIDYGQRLFATPFAFAPGRVCRNFDELALACQEHWAEAVGLLRRGELGRFLGSVGRADLAAAAREAGGMPDADRGLDFLLGRLPVATLDPPSLRVDPAALDLGRMRVGEDRVLELVLVNRGKGLLYGSAVVEGAPWLTLGDGPAASRPFQFLGREALTLRVAGSALRASDKPLEGRVALHWNGGTVVVPVRAEVPIEAFAGGMLAGARTPRRVAELARASPREAAALFESGAVAAWYRANGWPYPVRVPTASGLAAIQQFFEALGLVRPPAVELAGSAVVLRGPAGGALRHELEVRTHEKRVVYAHAVSDRAWLVALPAESRGSSAVLPLVVASVPGAAGETHTARVTVTANGNRHFLVPVELTVDAAHAPKAGPLPPPRVRKPPEAPPAPTLAAVSMKAKRWRDLLPLAALAAVLFGVAARDFLQGGGPAPAAVEPGEDLADLAPRVAPLFHDRGDALIAEPSMRFGLVLLREKDPLDPKRLKRLTYDELGRSNNTCLRIDGAERLFGHAPGRWRVAADPLGDDGRGRARVGLRSVWEAEGLAVTQQVEVVAGDLTRLLDTCLVRYAIENRDGKAHRVGLRVLLDTYIGANDGVPFLVPGASTLCDGLLRFDGDAVPDFIQALEREDLRDPGTVAFLRFRTGGALETPSRVTLGAWPDARLAGRPGGDGAKAQLTGWDVPVLPMKSLPPGDSAVTLYWGERPLGPGERREVGFSYGLGNLAGGEGKGRLAVAVGGAFVPGGRFSVTAYVGEPVAGETLSLELPEGFALAEGEARRPVPPLPPGSAIRHSPVTWQVRAPAAVGRFRLRVTSSSGPTQSQEVVIRGRRLFD